MSDSPQQPSFDQVDLAFPAVSRDGAQPSMFECRHADSLYGRCADCGMTWGEQEGRARNV